MDISQGIQRLAAAGLYPNKDGADYSLASVHARTRMPIADIVVLLDVLNLGGSTGPVSQYNLEVYFDGADGATSFVDENGRTWHAVGNAALETTSPVRAPSSGLVPDTSSYWECTEKLTDVFLGDGDFFIEYVIRDGGTPGSQATVLSSSDDGIMIAHNFDANMMWYNDQNGGFYEGHTGGTGVKWTSGDAYCCVQREGGILSGYLKNVRTYSQSDSFNFSRVATALQAGHRGVSAGSRPFVGTLGWIRMKRGVPRFAGSPPTITVPPTDGS